MIKKKKKKKKSALWTEHITFRVSRQPFCDFNCRSSSLKIVAILSTVTKKKKKKKKKSVRKKVVRKEGAYLFI